MTLYDFRLEVTSRLAPFSRAEGRGSQPVQDLGAGEPSAEAAEKQPLIGTDSFGSPESFVVRQLPLTYGRKVGLRRQVDLYREAKKIGHGRKIYNNDAYRNGSAKGDFRRLQPTAQRKALVYDVAAPLGNVSIDWPMTNDHDDQAPNGNAVSF